MYHQPTIKLTDLTNIGKLIDEILAKEAKTLYQGGYDDCLCDVIHFIQTGYWSVTHLAEQIKTELGKLNKFTG